MSKENKYKIFSISEKYDNTRINKYLYEKYPNINNVLIQKAIRNKDILINNQKIKNNQIIFYNNELKLSEFIIKLFNSVKKENNFKKPILNFSLKEIEDIKKSIIYKDEHLIAINKPFGLAVQSGSKIEKSLDDYLKFLKFEKEELPKLVHRLDKDTTGIIVVARDKITSEILTDYFKNKDDKIDKIYLTITIGKFNNNQGKISIPLIKKMENGIEKVYKDNEKGKEAITLYQVLDYNKKYNISLVKVKILTGRTHQIRVHLKEIGHPILGDGKYGSKKSYITNLNNKIHLHSYQMNIKDFYDKNINLKADLPQHFKDTLKQAKMKI